MKWKKYLFPSLFDRLKKKHWLLKKFTIFGTRLKGNAIKYYYLLQSCPWSSVWARFDC